MADQPFNLKTLEPWHEVNSILSRMKSLTVEVGGKDYDGEAFLRVDDDGGVLLFIPRPTAKTEVLKKGKAHAAKTRA